MGHFWVNETNEVNETNGSKVTSSQTLSVTTPENW